MDYKMVKDPEGTQSLLKSIFKDYEKSVGMKCIPGSLYEAKTVKGGKNIIILLAFVHYRDGKCMALYAHGDKPKKVNARDFYNGVAAGDLEPKKRSETDFERLQLASVGMECIAKGTDVDTMLKERMGLTPEEQTVNRIKLGI